MSTAGDLGMFIAQNVIDKGNETKKKRDKYIAAFEEMIEHSLELFTAFNMAVVNESDEIMADYLNRYIRSFRDVYIYYEQHDMILKAFKPKMDRLRQLIHMDSYHAVMLRENGENGYEVGLSMSKTYHEINSLLVEVQTSCVKEKG